MTELERLNGTLQEETPAVWQALAPLGRRIIYPPDIPFQAAQARSTRYNATIGQITDGHGQVLRLGAIDRSLQLDDEDRNRALLYSPIDGLAELRDRWAEWQTPADVTSVGRPLVTVGLTHGLALVADLFATEGRPVVVPQPCWGNYNHIFGVRHGTRMVAAESYDTGPEGAFRWRPEAIAEALSDEPADEPAIAILNLPSNHGGYMPDEDERGRLVRSLRDAAETRPLVVICDDAYAGLVYDDAPARSLFWDLLGQHERLIPVRLSGATKEFLLFGGRVGFLTLPFDAAGGPHEALESKLKGLIRSGVGSPSALSQMVLLQSMRDGSVGAEIEAVREQLARRQRRLTASLERAREASGGRLRPLPFNAGAFALIELDPEIDAGELRLRLIEELDVGLVSIGDRYVRIAYCSLDEGDVDELVERLTRAVSG